MVTTIWLLSKGVARTNPERSHEQDSCHRRQHSFAPGGQGDRRHALPKSHCRSRNLHQFESPADPIGPHRSIPLSSLRPSARIRPVPSGGSEFRATGRPAFVADPVGRPRDCPAESRPAEPVRTGADRSGRPRSRWAQLDLFERPAPRSGVASTSHRRVEFKNPTWEASGALGGVTQPGDGRQAGGSEAHHPVRSGTGPKTSDRPANSAGTGSTVAPGHPLVPVNGSTNAL
jgi:hypothetical protein